MLVESAYKVIMKLHIRSVGPADFGSYRCVAKNSLGETDGNIKLYSTYGNLSHVVCGFFPLSLSSSSDVCALCHARTQLVHLARVFWLVFFCMRQTLVFILPHAYGSSSFFMEITHSMYS